MTTTVRVPSDLLASAMAEGNYDSKAVAITEALRLMVRISRLSRLRQKRGSMPDFSLDLDVLRDRV